MQKISLLCISFLILNACGGGSLSGTNNQSSSNNSSDDEETFHTVISDNTRGEEIWQTCKGCHGTNGEKSALGSSDIIGGQERSITATQLRGYREGTLNQHGFGGVMQGQTRNLTDSDIEDVSGYIETLSGY